MESAQIIACSKVITMHMLSSKHPTNVYTPHKGLINCVHINHTNKVIGSSGQDGRIVLVNAQKPDNQVFDTKFHQNSIKPVSVNAVMFSPNSYYIAAGASDSLVKIWDMKNHKNVFSTIKSHVAPVTSLAWVKNIGSQKIQGDMLASSSSTGDIFLHSVKNSNIVETFNTKNQEPINQIKVSESDGHCRLAACTTTGSITVWDLKNSHKDRNGYCYFNNGKKSSITSVSFSSFNPVLLAASSVDENLTFYDIHEKKSVKVISAEEPLTSINFHSDGHTLVAGGMYGGLFVYDLRKPNKIKQKLIGHDTAIKHTEFIKQFEPSSSMSGSRASKTSNASSALSNANSMKIPSSKSIQKEELPQKSALKNNFVTQNTEDNSSQYSKSSISQANLRKPSSLSSTGQEAIRNAAKQPSIQQPHVSPYQPQPQRLTSPPTNVVASNSQAPISGSSSSYQPYNYQNGNTNTVGSKELIGSSKDIRPATNFGSSGSIIHGQQQHAGSNNNELKEFIDDKMENLHMEIIHQFHEQQMELKKMIKELLLDSRERDQEIQQLKQEVRRLQNRTY